MLFYAVANIHLF